VKRFIAEHIDEAVQVGTHAPIEERKRYLADLLNRAGRFDTIPSQPSLHPKHLGLQLSEHVDQPGDMVFAHACSHYRPGPRKCTDWIRVKNPAAPAVRREAEEDWGRKYDGQ
jgi:ATP-dependent DNA ligase